MELNENVDSSIVLEHLKFVIKDKTIQLTDHLINKVTLENKIKGHRELSLEETERMEEIKKVLAGKNQTQHEKIVSRLEKEEKEKFRDYMDRQIDISQFDFAKKGIEENEKFIIVVNEFKKKYEKIN